MNTPKLVRHLSRGGKIMRPIGTLAAAIACWVNAYSIGNAQPRLSGAVIFSCNGSGSFDNDSWWNTSADGISANLYVTQPNSGINGPFINSGNANPATRINVPLSPGTYTFYMFGEPGNDRALWGLNLFFDSDDVNPRISVFAPADTAPSPPYPAFLANSALNTPRLATSPAVRGAGALRFTNQETVVTLTDFRWSFREVENLDRVSYFNNVPSGIRRDYVGHFTLEVTPVICEPGTQFSNVLLPEVLIPFPILKFEELIPSLIDNR